MKSPVENLLNLPDWVHKRISSAHSELTVGEIEGENIHEARKSMRRARGALKLLRPLIRDNYKDIKEPLKKAAHKIALLRDIQAQIENIREMIQEQESAPPDLLHELDEGLDEVYKSKWSELIGREKVHLSAAQLVERSREAAVCLSGLTLTEKGVSKGIKKAYQKARSHKQAFEKSGSLSEMHEWRKRTKDIRYQLESIRSAWPKMIKAELKSFKKLTDCLGNAHDWKVLNDWIENGLITTSPRFDHARWQTFIQDNISKNINAAYPLADQLFIDKPKDFSRKKSAIVSLSKL